MDIHSSHRNDKCRRFNGKLQYIHQCNWYILAYENDVFL